MPDILLLGPLADRDLRAQLGIAGTDCFVDGQLHGGRWAGIRRGECPTLGSVAAGRISGALAPETPALRRYVEVFAMPQVMVQGRRAFGIEAAPALGAEGQGDAWPVTWQPALARAIAHHIATRPDSVSAADIRARLAMIACWEDSKLRGAAQAKGIAPPRGDGGNGDALDVRGVTQPYAGYFAVEEIRLRHRMHNGGWSAVLDRGVFVSGDAAVVLPWDPVRDRVLLVNQLRIGPAARSDPHAWVLEPVAGRIDAGETPEKTVLREAVEEAGVQISRLIAAPSAYMSPGIVAEYIYSFVGIADLPDGIAGIGGLDQEHEDIRGILLSRAEMMQMALDGRIQSGPLLILALWLDREAARLRDQMADEDPAG